MKRTMEGNRFSADRRPAEEDRSPAGPSENDDPGIVGDFVDFLRCNKKWWLTPILVVTLLLVGAALLLPSPVAPFIYSLF